MSSQHIVGTALTEAPAPARARRGKVIPMYVCPGVKHVSLDYALFPLGGGLSELSPCPARDICLWYAAHDLGGELEFSDLPPEIQLAAQFACQPFTCPDFEEHDGVAEPQRRRAESPTTDRVVRASFQG